MEVPLWGSLVTGDTFCDCVFHSIISIAFTTLWANSTDDKLMIFSYFSQKIGFDISCKLPPTICMKYQNLSSEKKVRKIF